MAGRKKAGKKVAELLTPAKKRIKKFKSDYFPPVSEVEKKQRKEWLKKDAPWEAAGIGAILGIPLAKLGVQRKSDKNIRTKKKLEKTKRKKYSKLPKSVRLSKNKHGGKITSRMSGGQVVNAGYD
tara:strand:- start:910 stop:1284 length:375 start_codon:yes stop_codon:yes gene_type:complete